MPRGKKSGRGTPRGGGGRGGRGGIRGRGNHANSSPAPWQQAGLTLMEAARETSRHDHKTWNMNSLWTKPVSFVSAGNCEPLKQLEDLLHSEDADQGQPLPSDTQDQPKAEDTGESDGVASMGTLPADATKDKKSVPQVWREPTESITRASSPPFFLDTDRRAATSFATTAPATAKDGRLSSRHSDSSDEVILFQGRDSQSKLRNNEHICVAHMQQEITLVQTQIETETRDAPLFLQVDKSKKKPPRRRDQRPPKKSTSDDDALFDDYIENMRQNGEEDVLLQTLRNQQDLGGSDYIPSEESESDDQETDKHATAGTDASKPTPDERIDAENGQYQSESELDDETLAQLLAGHELGKNPNPFADSVDSDASDEPQRWVDDLDMMDWERPSLQRKKGKGARGRIRIEVSDSELEHTLQAAWKNDRFKKAERRRQREEMRALGQLGKNVKPDDLRIKYPQGISIDEVAEEMRSFLQGTGESLALPPMDKHARKVIHDLANKFNIKSKSVGNADTRRPTLYRTKRTQQYSAASFDQAVNRITRRYFPRLDGRHGKGAPRTIGTGRLNVAAATVQDGEIVGATAPELGVENRGRAMLEKMGWSKGTALGALDNKGILQPVSHAMKRSKAGLG